MRIGLVAWHLHEISGTGTVVRELLSFLDKKKHRYLIVLKEDNPDSTFSIERLQKLGFTTELISNHELSREAWLVKAEDWLVGKQADGVLYFDINVPKTSNKIKRACIIHDILPLVLPEYYLNPFKYCSEKRKYLQAIKSNLVITVSNFSKEEILRRLKPTNPKKVIMIHNGVGDEADNSFSEDLYRGATRKGVLYLGDFRNRKNLYKLAKAYLRLPMYVREEHPLTLIGDGRLRVAIERLYRREKALHQVVFLGKLSTDEVKANLLSAYIFVFPSVLEGFGLPVIEAQRHGLPVICGNHSSLTEVAGDSVYFAEVRSEVDIGDKMREVIADKRLHRQLAQKGYENSWRFNGPKMSGEYEKVFEGFFR